MKDTRTIKEYLLLVVRGLAMGAADVVPGVSGGTVAFITGIYDELLHSLKQIGPAALVILIKQGIGAFWRYINGNFLLAVFGGILLSIKTFASIIAFCLEHYPIFVWSFFTGLIVASIVLLVKTQSNWQWREWLACVIGVFLVVGISLLKPAHVPGEWWTLFLGGFIAICAMILPGISGSFILLLFGLYPIVLGAINDFNLVLLSSFLIGCICGLLAFSRILSWLLDNFHKTTLAVLIGFLVGSLKVTWPWKVTIESIIDRHGVLKPVTQANVSPQSYAELVGLDPQLAPVLLFALFGLFLVLLIDFLAAKFSR